MEIRFGLGLRARLDAVASGARSTVEAARLLAEHPPAEALAAYDAERRPATAGIVLANRKGGPERVIDEVEKRAPAGFTHVEDVIPRAELKAIVGGYAGKAGFATEVDRQVTERRAANARSHALD